MASIKAALRISLALAAGYALVAVGLWLLQRKLMYFPDAMSPPAPAKVTGLETVRMQTTDGVHLEAWWWPNAGAPAVLLLHGNAGNRAGRLTWMKPFFDAGYQVLPLDYRGYGGSEGSPSETGLYLDAQAALRWLETQHVSEVVLMAESLGTGVAVELATKPSSAPFIKGVVLHAAYDSVSSVAQAHYPWLPVKLLLRDRFDSMAKIDKVSAPLLFIHGNRDTVIAWDAGHRLYEHANPPKAWITVEGAGHNDLVATDPDAYYETILSWLSQHAPLPNARP